jgi:hypothetical protein
MHVISFTARLFYSQEKGFTTQWTGGWVDSRAGLDAVEYRKMGWVIF